MCALSSGSLSRCECGGLESRMEKGSSTHSFNGLKFGKKIYFEGVGSGLQPKIGGEEEEEEDAAAPPRSPAKKGRTGVGQGGQPPRCQVEGCKVDLSGAKAYYCRHKVCGVHSKSPMVIVAGLEQRFCQQCSRFHQLPEFDQGKRSCRRRLAGHNERRRKPPPVPLLSSRNATLSPSIFDNHFKTGGVVTTDFTSNCQLPWESSSQPPPPPPPPPLPNLLQPSTTRPCYTDEDCISGISDSTSSALSLLSNWGSRTQPLDLGVNTNFLATDVAQPSLDPAARYSWDFKGDHDHDHADDNSLHDMGLLPRMSHPTNTPYGRDLGLARPGDVRHHGIEQPGGFDSSLQHINWSL